MANWMVRAGKKGVFFDDFRERGIVAIGWQDMGDLRQFTDRTQMVDAVKAAYPSFRDGQSSVAGGQLYRFLQEFEEGDRVVTYDPGSRMYLCGEIAGPYSFMPHEAAEELRNQRAVRWSHDIGRDELSANARFSLGSLATIFSISDEVAAELWKAPKPSVSSSIAADTSEEPPEQDMEQLANEAIKDRIAALGPYEMQDLVAGLLRAMGYKTRVSPPGSDRGKDIVASPDGLGLEDPNIVVEVKHRRNQRIAAPDIRSFLGGRHPRDRGLYVSTGGFSRDAYYEAERANIPITLMDFEDLVEAIQDHYSAFDEETRQLLPLKAIYWPISK